MSLRRLQLLNAVAGLILLCAPCQSRGGDSLRAVSPAGHLQVDLTIRDHRLFYAATFDGEVLLRPSPVGFVLEGQDSLCFFTLLNHRETSTDERWTPVWGTCNNIRNHYRELTLELLDLRRNRRIDWILRVYDDGFAYRTVFRDSLERLCITSECSAFAFAENADCWWYWADDNTLEKLYYHTRLKEAPHVALPFTLRTQRGTCLSVLEAALVDYPMLSLQRDAIDSLRFITRLVPRADGAAVRTAAPFATPWRAVLVSAGEAGLLTSSLVLNLNEPCALSDVSWIKPMTYVGIWWEMHLGLSTWMMEGGRHGATTANAKKYIDFAAQHGIHGVLIEGWNTGWEQWGKPGAFDFITPYADFDLKDVVVYARSKDVEIIGHHETGGDIVAYEAAMDSAFAMYQRLGIRYVKTGYAGPVNPPTEAHHGQYMVNHYNKVMETAARYHIMLDVHEPVIPSGLSRTWPNLMTFEGVRGMEWNAWSEGNPPSHTCTLPFTRGLAGPMDYTPGIFDIRESAFADKRVKWNGLDRGNNAVHSTLSNQIALMIVLYSPLQMAADLVENYRDHPAFDIVAQLPATWDETRVLDAAIGEYVVVARRSGTRWFVGGITNETERSLTLPTDFLESGRHYTVTFCQDGAETHYEKNPATFENGRRYLDGGNPLKINMKAGGGAVLILQP